MCIQKVFHWLNFSIRSSGRGASKSWETNILPLNDAVSLAIRDQLASINNRPARQWQLPAQIYDVSVDSNNYERRGNIYIRKRLERARRSD